ncbi:MAG: DUF2764 family protein [Candidatus Cloacimonadaceae bacterium]|nr:DUF2764 family protein [Candidatus Cloacimonadaceae bacterium]
MLQHQYYYFVAGLPGLSIDDSKGSITPAQFLEDAKKQLSEGDYALLNLLRLPVELDNMLRTIYQTDKAYNENAGYPVSFWQEYLEFQKQRAGNHNLLLYGEFHNLPDFVHEITLEIFTDEELPPLLVAEHQLLTAFYANATKHKNTFIRKWFEFNAELQNIIIAINGRKFDVPFAHYLIGDGDVVNKLSKSHAADFGFSKEYALFETVLRIYEQNNLLFRERGFDILRFKWIDNQNFFEYFNIDRVLGYYTKLLILHRWLSMDADTGKDVFFDILNELENSFSFPPEYDIKQKK